jgi:hypothetical protein
MPGVDGRLAQPIASGEMGCQDARERWRVVGVVDQPQISQKSGPAGEGQTPRIGQDLRLAHRQARAWASVPKSAAAWPGVAISA